MAIQGRSPLKVDRVQIFEFWQVCAFFGLGRPRDQGGSLLWTRFTPGALVQRAPDPKRTISVPFLGFGPLLKSRSPLEVDGMLGLPPIYF